MEYKKAPEPGSNRLAVYEVYKIEVSGVRDNKKQFRKQDRKIKTVYISPAQATALNKQYVNSMKIYDFVEMRTKPKAKRVAKPKEDIKPKED